MSITFDQLPNEALDAAVKAYETLMLDIASREALGISIIAALNAWPGVHGQIYSIGRNQIILPIPQEAK